SVEEYAHRFTVHARYAPEYVSTEEEKIWRFQNGLRSEIRTNVIAAGGDTLEEAIERAKRIEWSDLDNKRIREERGFGNPGLATTTVAAGVPPESCRKSHRRAAGGSPELEFWPCHVLALSWPCRGLVVALS
ncbi:hypothetical protein ACR2XP_25535, partial [Klebsiella pneumoniae]